MSLIDLAPGLGVPGAFIFSKLALQALPCGILGGPTKEPHGKCADGRLFRIELSTTTAGSIVVAFLRPTFRFFGYIMYTTYLLILCIQFSQKSVLWSGIALWHSGREDWEGINIYWVVSNAQGADSSTVMEHDIWRGVRVRIWRGDSTSYLTLRRSRVPLCVSYVPLPILRVTYCTSRRCPNPEIGARIIRRGGAYARYHICVLHAAAVANPGYTSTYYTLRR